MNFITFFPSWIKSHVSVLRHLLQFGLDAGRPRDLLLLETASSDDGGSLSARHQRISASDTSDADGNDGQRSFEQRPESNSRANGRTGTA